jgi:glycosyltransferase involved in cell wall biosynthesis
LNTSLSVLLPVYNREQQLASQVDELLDVVAELTSHFDILIIDDGSTDDTAEVAQDLARQYPQINLVRHSHRRGLAEAVQTGLKHTRGETIIVGDDQYRFDSGAVQKLWPLRNDPDVVIARQPRRPNDGAGHWLQRLFGLRGAAPAVEQRGELQLIRRQALRELQLGESASKSHRLDRSTARATTNLRGPKFLGPIKRFMLEE